MKRVLWFRFRLPLIVATLAGCAPLPIYPYLSPDSQNPHHGRVRENLASLLRAVELDPMGCSIIFVETKNLSAVPLGKCLFMFSTGLASTGDERLIRGIQANRVAYEILGYADIRKAPSAVRIDPLAILAIMPGAAGGSVMGTTSFPFIFGGYSPSQQAEADKKAAEILRLAGDPDPAGTLLHASERIRDAGVVERWPAGEPRYDILRYKIMMALSPVPGLERTTYTLGQKWSRSDGDYRLTKMDRDLYTFSAGPGQEIHLTKDLMVAEAKKGGWVTEFDYLPEIWPLAVGKWGIGEGRWRAPNDPARLRVEYKWSIDAYEEIQVPAGTFKAFRIVLSWQPGKRIVSWYAPELGQLVKADYGEPGPLTFELVAVDRTGKDPRDK